MTPDLESEMETTTENRKRRGYVKKRVKKPTTDFPSKFACFFFDTIIMICSSSIRSKLLFWGCPTIFYCYFLSQGVPRLPLAPFIIEPLSTIGDWVISLCNVLFYRCIDGFNKKYKLLE